MYRFGFVPISKRKRVVRDMFGLWWIGIMGASSLFVVWSGVLQLENNDFVSDSSLKNNYRVSFYYALEWNDSCCSFPVGGALQHPLLTAPSRQQNEYAFEDDFETWSPEGSSSRTPEYMLSGHNLLEPRMSFGWNYGPERLRRQHRNSSRYWDHNNKYGNNGNMRWQDQRWSGLCRCVWGTESQSLGLYLEYREMELES